MKTFDQVESLIWTDPDTLNEQEIENYLQVAEVQCSLDRDNFMALVQLSDAEEAA